MPFRSASFARYAWGVLTFNVAVVLWGAYVRASGSGAGCGRNWPMCTAIMEPSASVKTLIEFTHRATSGLDLVLVALLVLWAFRVFPKGHAARLGSVLSAVFLMTEALIGAALVLLEHVASNPSSWRAVSLSTHLVNTLTLLACLTLTAWWGGGRPRLSGPGRGMWVSLLVFAVLGVTGAIAALGDTLFPVQSLSEGLAQDLNPAANLFVRLRWLHPLAAALCGAWLFLYLHVTAREEGMWRPAAAAALLLGAQVGCGILNLLLLAPIWMQMLHLLMADAAWIALVLVAGAKMARKTI